MTIVIGLLGGRGAGKSTVGARLQYLTSAKQVAIASPIKRLTRELFGLTEAQVNGNQAAKDATDPLWQASPRELICRVGDALRLTYGRTFQVERAWDEIHAWPPPIAVVTDVRYVCEAEFLRERGAFLWRINYPQDITPPPVVHGSEREWMVPPADVEISPRRSGIDLLNVLTDEAFDGWCAPLGVTRSSHVRRISCT
jgi:hypothetical protein